MPDVPRGRLRDSAADEAYVGSLRDETIEWLLALFVDDDLNLLSVETIAKGGIGSVTVDKPRIICRGHVVGATGFILVHNHPSGDPTPSQSDIQLTRQLRRLAAEMEMPMLDHFVVGKGAIVRVV